MPDHLAAFEAVAVPLALLDREGATVGVNRALVDLLGYSGGDLLDHVHEDDRDELRLIVALALTSEDSESAEHRWVGRDGRTLHLRSAAATAADGHLVLSLTDNTEHRRLHAALAQSEMRYRALVEHLPDTVIALFDADLRLTVVEGREGLQGLTLAEVLDAERYAIAEPHYRAALLDESRQFDFEDTVGRTWWVQVVPLHDDARRVIGGMAVWRDVTARVTARRALQEHAAELERSNAELEQFAYIASHDLSEPLRMITSYLQLLERRYAPQLDDDARDFIDYAVDGGVRMRALIDDLLAYSRVGRGERRFDPVDLGELVDGVAETLTAERDPAPEVTVGELPAIAGDAPQLTQLFQNVIGNALKFTRPGEAARVRISATQHGRQWRITVDDAGIGIDAEHSERIFGVFQRLHGRDEYPGTGVGLAIARKVAERHGGRIWAEPREGGGSRFHVELPGAR